MSGALQKSKLRTWVALSLPTNVQKATKLVRHYLPSVKPYWLSQIISLSHMCFSISSRRIHGMIFPGTRGAAHQLVVPQIFLSPFLKYGSVLSLFPVSRDFTWPFKYDGEWLKAGPFFPSSLCMSCLLDHSYCTFKLPQKHTPPVWKPFPDQIFSSAGSALLRVIASGICACAVCPSVVRKSNVEWLPAGSGSSCAVPSLFCMYRTPWSQACM